MDCCMGNNSLSTVSVQMCLCLLPLFCSLLSHHFFLNLQSPLIPSTSFHQHFIFYCPLPTFHFLLSLGQVVLLPNRLDQDLQRLHLPLGQQSELRAKEHEVLETRIQMRRHLQRLQGPEEGAVNDAVDPKEPAEDLAAQRRELRRLKDPERLGLVVVVGELGLVVDLVGDPLQHLLDVHRRRHGHRRGVPPAALAPPVLHAGREALPGPERIQVGVLGHDGPDGGHVVVEVDGVDGHPAGARLARRQGHGVVQRPAGAERLFRVAVQAVAEGAAAVAEGLEGASAGGEGAGHGGERSGAERSEATMKKCDAVA
mmetsp:Transcript_17741/g.36964  ORF Transcript_17741/g.36964 Transcript_17741/m.36964 type:complete len:313 (+) Transcript_17741:321-1259(+)